MRRFLQILCGFALLCAACAEGQAPSGFIPVSGSRIVDLAGNPASNAQVCAKATNAAGVPIGVRVGGGGQVLHRPVCATVTAGAWTLNLPDTALTAPANVCLALTVTDTVTGVSMLDGGYSCLQPSSVLAVNGVPTPAATWCAPSGSGTACNFDLYPPNQPALAVVQAGPAGQAGPKGDAGAAGAAGAAGTVTASGVNGNFMVPGLLNTTTGLGVTSSNCSLTGNYNESTCAAIQTNFAAPNHGSASLYLGLTQYGKGWNLGNYGGWSSNHLFTRNIVSSMRGITDGEFGLHEKRAAGDFFNSYDYLDFTGGALAPSDEAVGDHAVDMTQYGDYFHGTAGVAGTGVTTINPVFVSGDNFTTDESLFINTSRGVIHTNFLANTAPGANAYAATLVPGVSGLVYQRPVTAGTITASTTVMTCAPNTPNTFVVPIYDATQGVPTITLTCTILANGSGGYVPLPSSGVVTAQGSGWIEQVAFTAGTVSGSHTQTVTAAFRYPNNTLNLWFGGLQGYAFSVDSDYNYTGTIGNPARQLYYALGSVDGTNMAYASEAYGSTSSLSSMPIPTISGAPATAAITLFPYAEVVANNSNGANPTLEPNVIAFQPSDTVEDPYPATVNWKVDSAGLQVSTPCYASGDCEMIYRSFQGAGVSYGAKMMEFVNGTSPGYYTSGGGQATPPDLMKIKGSWQTGMNYYDAPVNMLFAQNFNGTAPVCIVCWGQSSNAFSFDPVTNTFKFSNEVDANSVGVTQVNAQDAIIANTQQGDTHLHLGANDSAEHNVGPAFDLEDAYGQGFFHSNSYGVTFSNIGSGSPNVFISGQTFAVGANVFTVDVSSGAVTTGGVPTFTGSCPATATLTVKNGLITGCS